MMMVVCNGGYVGCIWNNHGSGKVMVQVLFVCLLELFGMKPNWINVDMKVQISDIIRFSSNGFY